MERYLLNERGHTMNHTQVKEALGLVARIDGKRITTDVKIDGAVSTEWKTIQGVQVRFMSTAEAKEFWGTKGLALRAIAECPHCARVVAASRINQHARVHKEG